MTMDQTPSQHRPPPPPPGSFRARLANCTCPHPRIAEEIWKAWPESFRKPFDKVSLYLIRSDCPIHAFQEID